MTKPDYRAFARDLLKLCKKHGVKLRACDEGTVLLGPGKAKIMRDFPYCEFAADPAEVTLGREGDANFIKMSGE